MFTPFPGEQTEAQRGETVPAHAAAVPGLQPTLQPLLETPGGTHSSFKTPGFLWSPQHGQRGRWAGYFLLPEPWACPPPTTPEALGIRLPLRSASRPPGKDSSLERAQRLSAVA